MNNSYYRYYYPNYSNLGNVYQPINEGVRGIGSTLPRSGGLLSRLLGTTPQVSAVASAAPKLTWTGFLNGASKTLGVINQAIPVVYQIKPIVNNAKTMFRVMKEINKSDTKTSNTTTNEKDTTNIKSTDKTSDNTSSNINTNNDDIIDGAPTFFV